MSDLKRSAKIVSFDLNVVSSTEFPADLGLLLRERLRRHGVEVEVYPSFEVATWGGGFLPMKVLAMPAEFIGGALQSPALSGFEVDFRATTACFRSPASRTTTEFALLNLSAAAIAEITGGRLEMPEAGITSSENDPFDEAVDIVRGFVSESSEEDRRQYPFERWLD